MKKLVYALLGALILSGLMISCQKEVEPQWPEITKEAKPWARWWWQGSAVRTVDITASLQRYRDVGLGGLEITPIYGVKGYEDRFLPFLSTQWMEMFQFTLEEAKRLDVGIDLANASGWPFGGPWVSSDDACRNISYKYYSLREGQSLQEKVVMVQQPLSRTIGTRIEAADLKEPLAANGDLQAIAFDQVRFGKALPLVSLMAYNQAGESIDLTTKVDADGTLDWVAPAGEWQLYALFMGWHGKMVERAAPGGEGDVIDHFSSDAIQNYLSHFDEAFEGYDISYLRYYFNDSYEVDDAQGESNWTPAFFEQFQNRRGYDLRGHLPALFGRDTPEKNARVLYDYRRTIHDLLIDEYSKGWQGWAAAQGKGIRNQAHGSPANILDVYAVSDVPEIEGNDIYRIKMAPAAAHITGKPLISSESATWLGEHFHSTLGDVKRSMDLFLLGGVNHTFYHGANFSPEDAPFPGWLFYAAVHFTPHNPFWSDFGKFNEYIARCQSFLQAGMPDNDVLFYFPVSDLWSTPGNALLEHINGIPASFNRTSTRESVEAFEKSGYAWDFISDNMILNLTVNGKVIETGGTRYQVIYLPECKYIPTETMEKLLDLARSGATVLVHKALPANVAGFSDWEARSEAFASIRESLTFEETVPNVQKATFGKGAILMSEDIAALLAAAGVGREPMYDMGLQCIRRQLEKSTVYFIKNSSAEAVQGWVPLGKEFRSAAIFDPMNHVKGYASIRDTEGTEVYLQLLPGETVIVEAYRQNLTGQSFPYYEAGGDPVPMSDSWTLAFESGGPELPEPLEGVLPGSWTEQYPFFSGTGVYSYQFGKPEEAADAWLIDLGKVGESASVYLNDEYVGTVFQAPYTVTIPDGLFGAQNKLVIKVSNSMLNRVIGMDRNGEDYRIFYNTNFPARIGTNRGPDGNFNAAGLEPRPSGLQGPVTCTPLVRIQM